MSKCKLILSMFVFGTIGIFVKYIPFPSSFTALVRGVVGTIFLLAVMLISGKRISKDAVKRNFVLLVFSGIAIGVNWILLFEAYRFTTVATATLCYYLAPVFVLLLSPLILKEKLTVKKLICIFAALSGMVLISGVLQGNPGNADFRGITLGIGAAIFYASVILMNKFLGDISAFDSTIMQLLAATVILIPYTLLTEDISTLTFSLPVVLLLLVVGVLHTGIAYCLYFSSMTDLDGQTIAIFSYIDPAVAIFLSAFLLKESMDMWSIIGAVLILGSTLLSEINRNGN